MKNVKINLTYTKIPILGSRRFNKVPTGVEISGAEHEFTNEDLGEYRALTIEKTTFIGRLNKISPESIELEDVKITTTGIIENTVPRKQNIWRKLLTLLGI